MRNQEHEEAADDVIDFGDGSFSVRRDRSLFTRLHLVIGLSVEVVICNTSTGKRLENSAVAIATLDEKVAHAGERRVV
jgi:hypothetical protein